MCYDNNSVDQAASKIFGTRVMLFFGVGQHQLDQCQNFPTCLLETKYEPNSGKAIFKAAFCCNHQSYDLVLNVGVLIAIYERLVQNRLLADPPEIKIITGRRVLDPAYIKAIIRI